MDETKENGAIAKSMTLLITAAGTTTSVNVIKYVAEMGNVRIVTADSNPAYLIAAPSRWSTSHHQVPPASQRHAFVASIKRICEEELVDAVYPVHDAEILAIAESCSSFPDRVQLPQNAYSTILNCNDKWISYDVCRNADLPVPRTILGSNLQRCEFTDGIEFVRKPRRGVGSYGVRRVKGFDELDAETDLNDESLYQVPCQGSEFTIDVLCLKDIFVAIVRERLEVKAGVCTKARVFVDPWITQLSRGVAKAFGLAGLFCFQLFGDLQNYDFQIIDINPRCGGGTALSAAAGFPIYEAYFSAMLGLQERDRYVHLCDERSKTPGSVTVCRYYEEVVTQLQGKIGLADG